MKICSWNLWFDYLHQEKRIRGAMDELLKTNCDVVCCQEVTESILKIINNHPIVNTYTIFADKFSTQTYGEIFIVKKTFYVQNFYSVPFPRSRMGRRIYVLESPNAVIVNIHLESEFSGKITGEKATQLITLFKFINLTYPKNDIIIVGDTNLTSIDDTWSSRINTVNGFIDYYGSRDKQNTYDYVLNTNVLNCYRSRLDRCYIRSNSSCHPIGFELLGLNPIQSINIHPSDHFGICVTFMFSQI